MRASVGKLVEWIGYGFAMLVLLAFVAQFWSHVQEFQSYGSWVDSKGHEIRYHPLWLTLIVPATVAGGVAAVIGVLWAADWWKPRPIARRRGG